MNRKHVIYSAILGALMGFVYSITAELINPLALPGVPLFDAPPGILLTVVASTLGGALLGVLAASPGDTVIGLLFGGLALAVATSIVAVVSVRDKVGMAFLLFYTFFSRAVIFLPVAWLVRWAGYKWAEAQDELWTLTVRRKGLVLLLALFLPAFMASFSQYSPEFRYALSTTHQLLQRSEQARSVDEIPEEVRFVPGFIENARGSYTLEPSDNPDVLPVQRPVVAFGEIETLVIIRYENGYTFGCAYTPPRLKANCWTFND